MKISDYIKRRPLVAFFVLTFAWAWGCWAYLVVSTPPDGMQAGMSPAFFLLAILGGIGPSLAGIVVTRIVKGKGSVRAMFAQLGRWRVHIGWYAVALLTVPLVSLIVLVVQAQILGKAISLSDIGSRIALGLVWPIFASLGEEFGWRAFALPCLQKRHTALTSSLIVGLVWGMWHLPTDFIALRSYGVLFIPYFIVVGPLLTAAYSIPMTWVYNNTTSMLLVVLYHFSITATAITLPTSILDLSKMESILCSLVITVAFWFIAGIVLVLAGAKRLTRDYQR